MSIAKKENLPNEFEMKISSNYYISDKKEPIKHKMISHLDDILQLREYDEYHLLYQNNNLGELVMQFKEAGYEPQIRWKAGCIKEVRARFTYKLPDKKRKVVNYIIDTQHLDTDRINEDIWVESEEKHNALSKVMFDFNKAIFTENHKSYYCETDINVLDECRTVIPHGQLWGQKKKDASYSSNPSEIVEIDICKAYTSAFSKIKSIPVFNEFDVWRPFLNTDDINTMGNHTLYMVKVCQGNLFFNKKINLVYGKFLKQLVSNGVVVKILYYKKPSQIHKVKYKKLVNELYSTKISSKAEEDKRIKKLIANITFGLLEKGQNKVDKSKIFDTLDETLHYQKKYGGRIFSLDHYLLEGNDPKLPLPKLIDDDDSDDEEDADDTEEEEEREKKYIEGWEMDSYEQYNVASKTSKYYILNVSDSRTLTNGFRYIKEMLLQYHNFAMYDAYRKLKIENGIDVYAVKTDALHIHHTDLKKAMKLLEFHNDVGGWRHENIKRAKCPNEKYMYKNNDVPNIPIYKNEQLIVKDEWDTKTICEQILDNGGNVIIKGKVPGTGKSYIAEYFSMLGKNVCFIVPTNRLLQEKKGNVEATTYNKFFSIAVDAEEKLPPFDHSPFDVICFDEVLMANRYILNKVRLFCLNHSEKIIIGTGDVNQLQSVEQLTNCQDHKTYIDNCMDVIYKNEIFLQVCKRVGGKDTEDGELNRNIINEMYNDLWVHKLPVEEFALKHFPTTNDIMSSEHNIAYTNIRCRNVANEVRKRLGKKDKYEIGETLIARKWVRQPRINVNLRYTIIGINGKEIRLQNIVDEDDVFSLDVEQVEKIFIYSHCATTHSSQGASINTSITIHEWDKSYLVSREWFWTSITRAVDFRKVRLYLNKDFDKEMELNMIQRYFERKIEGYKSQDRKSMREIDDEEYVDVKWCMDRFKGCCGKCGVKFEFDKREGRLTSNFTAQRTCNETAHYKDNCQGYCVYCNCSAC